MKPSRLQIASALAWLAASSPSADVVAATILRAVRCATSVACYPALQDFK